jgi:hypothetical protein
MFVGHFSRKDVIMAKVVFACDCIVTIAILAVDSLKLTELLGMSTL